MKLKVELPKNISVEADVDEQEIKSGIARLYNFIKTKLPFKVEVKSNGTSKHKD